MKLNELILVRKIILFLFNIIFSNLLIKKDFPLEFGFLKGYVLFLIKNINKIFIIIIYYIIQLYLK